MMIMIKSTVVLTTLFLAMTGISAEKLRGVRGLHGSHHGHKGMGSHKGKGSHKGMGSQKGMRGPKGWGGPKDEFGGPCSKFDESLLEDLSCPTDVDNEPECAVRDGELGTWLCRTMFDRFTGESDSFSTCGNATRALPLDDCGCCEGACPVECTCGCTLEGAADTGVLVTETGPEGDEHERCFAPENAISIIAKPEGRFQCVTECD
jgi:hypothetical protein